MEYIKNTLSGVSDYFDYLLQEKCHLRKIIKYTPECTKLHNYITLSFPTNSQVITDVTCFQFTGKMVTDSEYAKNKN